MQQTQFVSLQAAMLHSFAGTLVLHEVPRHGAADQRQHHQYVPGLLQNRPLPDREEQGPLSSSQLAASPGPALHIWVIWPHLTKLVTSSCHPCLPAELLTQASRQIMIEMGTIIFKRLADMPEVPMTPNTARSVAALAHSPRLQVETSLQEGGSSVARCSPPCMQNDLNLLDDKQITFLQQLKETKLQL